MLEGYGTSLSTSTGSGYINVVDSDIQWAEDENPRILCPPELNPFAYYQTGSICCSESYLYLIGYDQNLPSLSLPAPIGTQWSNAGSLCFYLFFPTTTVISYEIILVQFNPITILIVYQVSIITFDFRVGNISLYVISLSLPATVWDSFCFTFIITGNQAFYGLSDARNGYTNSWGPFPAVSMTPTGNIMFLPNNSTYPLYVKNLLVLNKAISQAEHSFYFWGNP